MRVPGLILGAKIKHFFHNFITSQISSSLFVILRIRNKQVLRKANKSKNVSA